VPSTNRREDAGPAAVSRGVTPSLSGDDPKVIGKKEIPDTRNPGEILVSMTGQGEAPTASGAPPSGSRTPSTRLRPVKVQTEKPAPAVRAGLRYLVGLDGLRGIAIIMVLLHNLTMTSAVSAPPLGRLFEWGWIGVQLFFVMSGYLITRNLFATPLTPRVLAAFMARRWLRIVPVCYALLVVYFWIVPYVFDAPSILAARGTQIWYWLFLSNWAEPFGIAAPGLGHLWSLGVEIQFYFLWPVVVLLAGPRRFGRACLSIIVIGLVASIALRADGASYQAVYKFTITRMSALAMGALVAVVAERPAVAARIPLRGLAWGTALALAAIVVWRGGFDYKDAIVETIGLKLAGFLFALWLLPIVGIAGDARGLAARLPTAPWLGAIGRVSYAMYVVHYPLHWAAMKRLYPSLLEPNGAVSTPRLAAYVVVASVATFVVAHVTWRLVERPTLAFKRFFPPTGVRSPTLPLKTLSARALDRLDQ
jgi:peptidoglycan/LPS O-acetylase OafA/YrhL